MKLARKLEFNAMARLAAIDSGDPYKTKNKKCIMRDNILISLVKKHKAGKMSDLAYFNAVVKANKGDYDLPGANLNKIM